MKKLLFTFSIVVICFVSTRAQNNYKEITLEDIWKNYTFYPQSIERINSMNDGENYTVLENEIGIVKYSYKTGDKVEEILRLTDLKAEKINQIEDYSFSADESKILLTTAVEPIYRHSYNASFYVYDVKTKTAKALSDAGKQQIAVFSPDGNQVAFLRANNLFIKDLATNTEYAITNDGEINKIINGGLDWVYEEEFNDSQYNFLKSYVWSSDGKKIAFYRFDESQVKEFNMTMYGTLYPEWYKFKYPKAGETNSTVTIHVYDLASKQTTKIDTGTEIDQYIPRIRWTKNENVLCVERLNRLQNKHEIMLVDANTGVSSTILTFEDSKYVEVTHDNFAFLNDGKSFITSNEIDGYNHLYLYDMSGNLIQQITKGNFEISKVYGIDETTKTIFYTSTEDSPMQRNLYSIKLDGSEKTKLSTKSGVNEPAFSNGFKYFINTNSDANSPYFVSLCDAKGKQIRVLEKNDETSDKIKKYGFIKKEFIKITTEKGIELNAWIIKPPKFDENKKYPVFMYVYGGPGYQTVMDEWDYSSVWHQMLAQKGYIVVSVDTRGCGGRGADFRKVTYGQLGNFETIDQIDAAKYLGTLKYVDKNRIGIQGWSYGGYMSTLCITKGFDVFKMAIAVAPVTNWRYYDSAYTERYMGLPKDNAAGYDDNSPINHVAKLKGKYLLVHGTADDNVHFQNSMELNDALVKNNKQFDMQFYTNKNHSIYGGYTRLHLYTKMTSFILENL